MSDLYIGLMSGTSLDGVDAVLVDISAGVTRVLAHSHRQFDPALAAELLALNAAGDNELHRAALAGNALVRVYADAIIELLATSGTPAGRVRAVGAHGQTVRHRPREFDGTGYTIQVNSPALLAELSGIDVIADLRSRDVAAGGQGAPLVPSFHRAVFAQSGDTVAVLNIGGISNLTVLHADGRTIGFDCGPGNVLMDHWCRMHTGKPYDEQGAWSATGRVDDDLLAQLLAEPYLALAPPKSTGRDLFHPTWLDAQLRRQASPRRPEDVQATLTEFTAATCAGDVLRHAPAARELLVCGGGAFNNDLMRRIAARLAGVQVQRSDARGLPAMQVEACAFAWLARAFCERELGSLSAVTGATGPRLLGALYPA
ncbi:MAG: anhydro-N-acetylmuramic acid kinase [Burkholderiales bacterium]